MTAETIELLFLKQETVVFIYSGYHDQQICYRTVVVYPVCYLCDNLNLRVLKLNHTIGEVKKIIHRYINDNITVKYKTGTSHSFNIDKRNLDSGIQIICV